MDDEVYALEKSLQKDITKIQISISEMQKDLHDHLDRHDTYSDKFWKIAIPLVLAIILGVCTWTMNTAKNQVDAMNDLTVKMQQQLGVQNGKSSSYR